MFIYSPLVAEVMATSHQIQYKTKIAIKPFNSKNHSVRTPGPEITSVDLGRPQRGKLNRACLVSLKGSTNKQSWQEALNNVKQHT